MANIDRWGIVALHIKSLEEKSWIAAISLGYTLLEMELLQLLRSSARPSGKPLAENDIPQMRYVMSLATLARKEGFLPESIFREVSEFNATRNKVIHKLLDETVTMEELELAANLVNDICFKIQSLWITFTLGPEEVNPNR